MLEPLQVLRATLLAARLAASALGAVGLVSNVFSQAATPGLVAELKPVCHGLMIRDFPGPASAPTCIDSVVVNVTWAALESADEVFSGPGWQEIENARRRYRSLRLRILAGTSAPDFVKRIGGPGVSAPEHGIDASHSGGIAIWNGPDEAGGTIPRFWLSAVLDQYEQLMTEVARRYEEAPEIADVVASGAMTLYAEPFYRAHTDIGTNRRLFEAGLNLAQDDAAHRRVIEIHHRLFTRTRTSLAINAWDIIDDSPTHQRSDFRPTAEFVRWARGLMGPRLVLQNNGTGLDANPDAGSVDTNHFAFLRAAAGPKGFQTRTWTKLGSTPDGLYRTFELALTMEAGFVELPAGFQASDPRQLQEFDARMEVNAAAFERRPTARLANLSTRGHTGSGESMMIAGFVLSGSTAKKVLLRGLGPALAGFGVSGGLGNPQLALYDGSGRLLDSNDDWDAGGATLASFAQVGAFPLAAGSRDAALERVLAPGAYTVQVMGAAGGSGVALVEIYESDAGPARLANISTRLSVGPGAAGAIPGLVVSGSGARRLLMRAIGPALAAFGVPGTLADPKLTVTRTDGSIVATNDDWIAGPGLIAAQTQVGAFGLAPGSRDAVLLLELVPGNYTALVEGANNTAGAVLVEIYEVL